MKRDYTKNTENDLITLSTKGDLKAAKELRKRVAKDKNTIQVIKKGVEEIMVLNEQNSKVDNNFNERIKKGAIITIAVMAFTFVLGIVFEYLDYELVRIITRNLFYACVGSSFGVYFTTKNKLNNK